MNVTVPAHLIRHNKTSRVPRRWVYLDTEAHVQQLENHQRQSWRLGVTCLETRRYPSEQWTEPEWRRWDDPTELWTYVSTCATESQRTVVLAHNLGYDLRISRALLVLPALGWRVDLLSIGGRNVTMTMRRGKASLLLCDFASWVPKRLDEVAAMMGTAKRDLPAEDDTTEAWYERCEQDVAILRAANRAIVQWIMDEDLGNWQRTGAGFAYANWRHKFLDSRVLVHADPEARDAEVAALGTGRCEAWRHGQLPPGRWVEWDLPMAYPSVARDVLLPTTLGGHDPHPDLARWRSINPDWRVLYRATVDTPQPTLAVHTDEGWCWPTGRVTGWWWDTEVWNAEREGATVQLHHAVFYQATPALRSWAQWIIPYATDPAQGAPELLAALTKHMGRALIGRFGAKYPQWQVFAPAPDGELSMGGYLDSDTDERGRMLTVAGQTYVSTTEEYVADACPALLGVVMAECRVRLWRIMVTAGLHNLAYCDTDSVIVNRAGDRRLRAAVAEGELWGLRRKASHPELEVLGPRQLILGRRARIAGVARGAERVDKDRFAGERWDGMTTTLESGTPDVVVVRKASWTVRGRDNRRRHLRGGTTEALVATEAGQIDPRTPSDATEGPGCLPGDARRSWPL